MCPHCHSVKEFMKDVDMEGEEIDATIPEGLEQSQKFNVISVPTVIFLEGDKVKSVAHSIEEIKRIIENKSLL